MITSCGIIIVNELKQVLMGHVTGQDFYDLPKGKNEHGETFIETALRECFEETSIRFKSHHLIDLGMFNYQLKKNLYLFKVNVLSCDYNLNNLKCCSEFISMSGKAEPEFDDYKWIEQSAIKKHCAGSMSRLFYGNIKKSIF